MSSRSSVDRVPARCSEGHEFDSFSHARFKLFKTLFTFHTELKIHHLYPFRAETVFTAAVLCEAVKS